MMYWNVAVTDISYFNGMYFHQEHTDTSQVVFYVYTFLCSPMNLLFVNLAIGDLIVTVFGTWFEFFQTVTHQKQEAGSFQCDFYGFATFAGGKYSTTTQ